MVGTRLNHAVVAVAVAAMITEETGDAVPGTRDAAVAEEAAAAGADLTGTGFI